MASMPRLAWILVALAICIVAFLQPAILIPLGVPGGLLLYALRDFVPADVLYSSYSGVDFASGVVVLASAMFWMMLTLVIRWRSEGRFISFLMRLPAKRIGLIAATINVLVFITMLATRDADYERLAETEACFRSGSSCNDSSAEPMYLAARPFYSSMHVSGVPWTEDAFFAANTPAMFATFLVVERVADVRYWFEAEHLSLTQESWVMAICFMTFAALWAFAIGAVSHRAVRWVSRARREPRTSEGDVARLVAGGDGST
jgi:hypothetical protein